MPFEDVNGVSFHCWKWSSPMPEPKDPAGSSRNQALNASFAEMTVGAPFSSTHGIPLLRSLFSLRKEEMKVGAGDWAEGKVPGSSVSFLTLVSNFIYIPFSPHFSRSLRL